MEREVKNVVTLDTFAKKTGCHFTTASRLRSGHRLPSGRLLGRIIKEFGLSAEEAMAAYNTGETAFGEYLQDKVFVTVYAGDTPEEALSAA
jgi:transcriptional regulator with XRE-family HTH domain